MATSPTSIADKTTDQVEDDSLKCNKDTGDTQRVLRKWSRGLLHFVTGGGHIEKWTPLYKYAFQNL